jgi:uncharacterized protein YjbI with pentapeptide repeats
MGARLRSWWQIIKQHRIAILVVAIIMVIAIALILIGYLFDWTGFNVYTVAVKSNATSGTALPTNITVYLPSKTLYDWMQLLFIPVVLAIAGFWFNHRERKAAELRAEIEQNAAERRATAEREIEQQRAKTERDIAEDNQREAALQAYINEMSELLLHENLRKSMPEDEVRKIARVRTLTVLPRLDSKRKRNVILFLYESGLIIKDNRIIDLGGADLKEADLSGSRLVGVSLVSANLGGANLRKAYLREADLRGADLFKANLRFAYLGEALMIKVNLKEADLQAVNLGAADLSGANMMGVSIRGAYLNKANLGGVTLIGADLRITNLIEAEMGGVSLDGANLLGAYLDGTNLTGVTGITDKELEKQAKSLEGATMPDGSIHE